MGVCCEGQKGCRVAGGTQGISMVNPNKKDPNNEARQCDDPRWHIAFLHRQQQPDKKVGIRVVYVVAGL